MTPTFEDAPWFNWARAKGAVEESDIDEDWSGRKETLKLMPSNSSSDCMILISVVMKIEDYTLVLLSFNALVLLRQKLKNTKLETRAPRFNFKDFSSSARRVSKWFESVSALTFF